jgi:23S rRNA (pseudouridine1915-N3)-methyltransferase
MKIYLANFDRLSSHINEEVAKYAKRLNGTVETLTLKNIDAFEKKFPADKFTRIALSEEGTLLSTEKLAEWINAKLSKNMVFLVGSSYGLEPEIKQGADLLLSLSPLTFSHEHAFLLLTEQIYRCFMIIKGHPYHHK